MCHWLANQFQQTCVRAYDRQEIGGDMRSQESKPHVMGKPCAADAGTPRCPANPPGPVLAPREIQGAPVVLKLPRGRSKNGEFVERVHRPRLAPETCTATPIPVALPHITWLPRRPSIARFRTSVRRLPTRPPVEHIRPRWKATQRWRGSMAARPRGSTVAQQRG